MSQKAEPIPASGSTIARIEVRSNVVACDFSTKRFRRSLQRDDPLVRHAPAENPHGDSRLLHRLPGELSQDVGKVLLSTSQGNDLSKRLDAFGSGIDRAVVAHFGRDYNTGSVIPVNTRSDIDSSQTLATMPKSGNTTDFWRRLKWARETCSPPKTMNQTAIAKEYGMSGQSAVGRWKTGGPQRNTKPSPEIVEKMALDTNVNVNWLWAGQGERRPQPALDSITHRILEVVGTLDDDDAKLRIFEHALAQRDALANPLIAKQVKEAAEEARSATVQRQRKKRSAV